MRISFLRIVCKKLLQCSLLIQETRSIEYYQLIYKISSIECYSFTYEISYKDGFMLHTLEFVLFQGDVFCMSGTFPR